MIGETVEVFGTYGEAGVLQAQSIMRADPSSSVNLIGVASWMFIPSLNHDSPSNGSRY